MLTRDRPDAATPAKRSTTSRKQGEAGRDPGLGDTSTVRVKGQRATAKQRTTIDGCLTKAKQLGASRRVLIAVVMTITQESVAGLDVEKTGNDDTGIFQQGRNWISLAGSKQPGPATEAFLVSGPTSWTKVHGSLKHAPGDLEAAIKAVQISVGGYDRWEDEATRTVTAWLGGEVEGDRTVAEPFEFTRGEKDGQREDSWDALGRQAEERAWYRWAQNNVLALASGDELRAAAPSLEIHGDEPWLLAPPKWEWAPGRPINQVELTVQGSVWGLQIGAMVLMAVDGCRGRFVVAETNGKFVAPELTVILERTAPKRLEPPHTTRTVSASSIEASSPGGKLLSVCRELSAAHPKYGPGAHGVPFTRQNDTQDQDCSSSVSRALHLAGLFGDRTEPIVSGQFGSWGEEGKGREFTVWWNDGHVWIEFHGAGSAKRYDTGGGSPGEGPRIRKTARNDQARFQARRYPGH